MYIGNYTVEFCPKCKHEVVIYAKGVTACHICGKPLLPCSACITLDCEKCQYDEKNISNNKISDLEVKFVMNYKEREQK